MKKLFLLLTLAVFALSGCTTMGGLDLSETAGPPGGPPVGPGTELKVKTIQPVEFTVATLPSLGTADSGTLALITDGDDATDCTTGSGTDRVMCRWSGSAWANAGDGVAAGSAEVQDEAFTSGNFDADTSHGVSQDDFYDLWHGIDADDDGSFADETWLTTYMTEAEFTTAIGAAYDTAAELDALFAAKQDASTAATDAELAALQADDLVTLSGVAIGSTHLATFTGSTITDNQTIKAAMQELETAVESAGAADAFTVKVDAGATGAYVGAANSDGFLRTDGTIVTYADGGDFVTIGLHDYLDDIAGITAAQGDIIYFDGTDWVNLAPSTDGYFLKTQGAGANPVWSTPAGGGDITAIGTCATGDCFVDGSTSSTALVFEMTDNAYETTVTVTDPTADRTITFPDATGTVLLADGTGSSLTAVDAITGDSATAFFDAGTIEHEYGGLEADVSAYDGLVKITGGSTSAVTTTAFAESILDDADEATFKATVNLEIGTDVLAQQTIGIADDNLLEVDGTPGDGEAAVFTANGINGLSEAEFKEAFNLQAGTDYEAVDAEIARADTADTIGADWEWQDGIAQSFGNDNDWEVSYDEAGTDTLTWTTAATAAAAATDPMILWQVDSGASGMTADQDIWEIAKGTTALLNLDEDGDLTIPGTLYAGAIDGGTTAWDGIGDPTGAGSIDFNANVQTILTSLDAASGYSLILKNDASSLSNDTYLMKFEHASTGDTDAHFWTAHDGAGMKARLDYDGSMYAASFNAIRGAFNQYSDFYESNAEAGDNYHRIVAQAFTGNRTTTLPDYDGEIPNTTVIGSTGYIADQGDEDITSLDKLEFYDTGLFIDGGADGVLQLSSDGVYHFDIDSETLIMDSGANEIAFSTDTDVDTISFAAMALTTTGAVTGGTVTDGTVTLAGDGTITGLSVGGLPDNVVDNGMMADDAITYAETTGSVKSLTPVNDTAANFAANFTGANLYGGTFLCSTTGTIQLPAVTAGMNFTIITVGAIAVVVEPNASDKMMLDGTLLDDADSATNLSTAGDIIVFQYMSADGWVATSNGWTDED